MDRTEYRECLAECFEEASFEIEGRPEYRMIYEAYQASARALRAGEWIEDSIHTIGEAFDVLHDQDLIPAWPIPSPTGSRPSQAV